MLGKYKQYISLKHCKTLLF